MVATEIKRTLDELSIACEIISNANRCKLCPLYAFCGGDYIMVETANKLDVVAIARLTCIAEVITERQEESEKTEKQKQWEAEADYWNVRRCDRDDYE